MKEISLTRGQVTIVDDEDYEYLNQWKWTADFDLHTKSYYAIRKQRSTKLNQKQKFIRMHRLIMNAPKGKVVDHINHDTLDNRKENLRIVSIRQNMQNKKIKGISKYRGVHWDKKANKWRASISINNKTKELGRFEGTLKGEREAAKAYERACRELGEELVCKINKK